jgi:hypothetical protein
MSGPIKLKRLRKTNPRLDINRVKILKALYKGGNSLLGDPSILKQVFPKYTYESDVSYEERCKRAFYENMFALTINQISAGLAQDPSRFEVDKSDLPKPKPKILKPIIPTPPPNPFDPNAKKPDPPEPIEPPPPEPELDDYWKDLLDDATAPSDDGSNQRSFDQVMRDVAVEALVTGWCWTQSELPSPDQDEQPNSLKEQEDSGKLRAYLIQWPTECVTDWQEKNGKLLWVRTYECTSDAIDPADDRDTITHTWTVWEKDTWTKYSYSVKPNEQAPSEDTDMVPTGTGNHTFGRVPWNRFDVSCGNGAHLHIGDLIESLCKNYFNRQNGESFQWVQYFYQQLYEFLGPEVSGIDTVVSEAQQDPSRAQRRRAPGMVHVRGNEDRAEFIGPDMGGAAVGRDANQDSRDAILRITAQMALAQDTSGAMLRRSGDSKRQDSLAQEIVLGAIGKRLIVHAKHNVCLLAAGRKDSKPPDVLGYARFNVEDTEAVINQAVLLGQVKIPSARAQIEVAYQVILSYLGDDATPDMKAEIRMQLEAALTQDQVTKDAFPPPPALNLGNEPLKDDGGDPPPDDKEPPKKTPFPPKKPE